MSRIVTWAPETRRHLGRVDADHAAADDHHFARGHARHAAQQDAAAAEDLLEVLGALLHRHPPRHLGHRRQQRQLAVRQLHRFVGHRHRAGLDDRPGQLFRRGKVEVGVDQLALPHPGPFDGDRLLHLHDHVGLGPHLVRGGQHLGADGGVVRVGKPAPQPGARLHVHGVPGRYQRLRAGGHERDAVLVRLDFLRYADDHGSILGRCR